MKNLLLLELVGEDCVASARTRFLAAQKVGIGTDGRATSVFWKIWNSHRRVLADDLVPGSHELIEYLATHHWRVVLLTTRHRFSPLFRTTLEWLRMKDFNEYWYDLAMHYPSSIPSLEWKAEQVWRYATEHTYTRVVYIDPFELCRTAALQQWNSRKEVDAPPLEIHSGITPFIEDLALPGTMRDKLLPLLEQRSPLGQCELFFETLMTLPQERRENGDVISADVEEHPVEPDGVPMSFAESPLLEPDWDDEEDENELLTVAPSRKRAVKRREKVRRRER